MSSTIVVAALSVAVVAAGASLEAQSLDAALQAEIDRRAERLLASTHLPGLAIGIVVGQDLVYARGFGLADRETGRPVTPETLFQIGSTTKSFTGTLLGMAVDSGLIDLDAPIALYLPPDVTVPTAEAGAEVLVRHIASHTSGLPRQPPTLRRVHGDAPVLAFTHFELYQSVARSTLEYEPGTSFSYSNFGFSLLGHLLERVTGTPYEVLLGRWLFFPTGMRSSTVTIWPQYEDRLARPYYLNSRSGELEDYTPWDTEALAPAGGITSSVEDLAKYIAFQLRASGAIAEVRAPVARFSDSTAYAMGWSVTDRAGLGRVIGHGGEVDGYTAHLSFIPERGVGVVLLTNSGGGPLVDLGDWLLEAVARADR